MDDKIAQTLDLAPLEQEPVVIQQASEVNDDYQYARGNMIATIEKGREALDGMLEIAQQSQSARGYEVVADLIKTITQSNKDLLELAKQHKDLTKEDGPKTVNNNLFIGSSAELLKLLKNKNGTE